MTLFGGPSRRALHSLAAPYALDALERDERVRFEKHLAKCARCAAEVRALSEDAVRLAWSTAAPPPPALRDRVLAAVRTTPQETPPRNAPRARPRRPPVPAGNVDPRPRPERAPRVRPLLAPLAAATAAAALVVAALFGAQAHRAQERAAAERDRAREIAHVLAAPDARATGARDAAGRGIGVIASAEEGSAVVTLTGMGEPPGGRVRQLWLLRPGTRPHSLGLFEGDTPLVARGMAADASSLAVTVEPDGGSPQPTGQPVVQLALGAVGFGE
ncbi:hypothetical protein GCM10010145_29040 [Streptomyces ruber]|uniref:Regulator of SigK n=2 Tax=Streptomyces TaxID=1883 RepID=A0A918BBI1_9ACTN|nr:anti-sigma factor [Streptomyces ruber]GGQ57383.1 hypothetical protein GCM10010145_29040 [Streptomyces ruber]